MKITNEKKNYVFLFIRPRSPLQKYLSQVYHRLTTQRTFFDRLTTLATQRVTAFRRHPTFWFFETDRTKIFIATRRVVRLNSRTNFSGWKRKNIITTILNKKK